MVVAESKLTSHLIELCSRLVKASAVVIALFLGLMPWASHIYDLLALPMMASLPAGTKMIATGVITPFVVPLKITILMAFIIALPWVFYQVWAFISPGLYLREKKIILPLVIASSLSF
jgi:sec-independent protein translocase protein TatC